MRTTTFILLFFTVAFGKLFAQFDSTAHRTTSVACTPVVNNGCNQILNPSMTAPPNYDFINPFGNMQYWYPSHGTPQLNMLGNQPPFAGVNYACMWSNYVSSGVFNQQGEGIICVVPKVVPGENYMLTFYKKFVPNSTPGAVDLENFYIRLVNCSEFTSYSDPIIPPVPTQNQLIYCETNVANNNWERVNVCFTPDAAYNAIWIYPKETRTKRSWLYFSYPELNNVTNFTAGPAPTTYPADCNVTIGPSVPNCGPQGASFYWESPSGQTYPVSATNQQLSINASNDYGSWNLHMSVPNTVTTNNTCSHSCNIKSSVSVEKCILCQNPTVTPIGPITYYHDYEASTTLPLTSSSAVSYQWYKNNVLIPGATSQTYNVPISSMVNYTATFKCVTECGVSNIVTLNYIACMVTSDYPVSIPDWLVPSCTSTFPLTLTQPNQGAGATYQWWFWNNPSCYYFSGQSANTVSLNSPACYTGDCIFTRGVAVNGSETRMLFCFGENQNCRTVNPRNNSQGVSPSDAPLKITKVLNNSDMAVLKTMLIPNPASTEVTLKNKAGILSVDLINLSGVIVKKIGPKGTNLVTFSVNNLPTGIYVCKITTKTGTEYLKLLVNR